LLRGWRWLGKPLRHCQPLATLNNAFRCDGVGAWFSNPNVQAGIPRSL
jgi:hypothetical protein